MEKAFSTEKSFWCATYTHTQTHISAPSRLKTHFWGYQTKTNKYFKIIFISFFMYVSCFNFGLFFGNHKILTKPTHVHTPNTDKHTHTRIRYIRGLVS